MLGACFEGVFAHLRIDILVSCLCYQSDGKYKLNLNIKRSNSCHSMSFFVHFFYWSPSIVTGNKKKRWFAQGACDPLIRSHQAADRALSRKAALERLLIAQLSFPSLKYNLESEEKYITTLDNEQ